MESASTGTGGHHIGPRMEGRPRLEQGTVRVQFPASNCGVKNGDSAGRRSPVLSRAKLSVVLSAYPRPSTPGSVLWNRSGTIQEGPDFAILLGVSCFLRHSH